MSFVYFKFLFINTIKRKPVWITWILFLFTCTCFIIILPLAAKMNTLQVWANTTMAICQTFMGMVASLFTAVLAINVFKDTNEEGTELIIISKPISRFKIVVTKFILFGFFCLLINLTTVLLSVFTIFLPRTEPQFYAGLLISMFIGNAITFAVFGSISILLTVKFAKVGVIVTNVVISLVFLIYQTLTLFVFSTPSIILDKNSMSASSYILHKRNINTGEYVEDHVVKFEPSEVSAEKKHPCQATNWEEMKDFWENKILSKDVTPILNITDLAGQLALTYLSYKTDEYAQRQANRMFALSRFYNYQLTSPASPEIDDSAVPSRPSFNWIYTNDTSFDLPEEIGGGKVYIPTAFGFEGIQPLNATRLRGYTDQVPIGTVRSKDVLSARDVYFEQAEWKKYQPYFKLMYDNIFDYRNYEDPGWIDDDAADRPIWFVSGNNLRRYYIIVWGILVGKGERAETARQYLYPEIREKFADIDYRNFDIKNVDDLNDRFIQFKNYCYWAALNEQMTALRTLTPEEETVFDDSAALVNLLGNVLGYEVDGRTFRIKAKAEHPDEWRLLEPNTTIPALNLLEAVKNNVKASLGADFDAIATTLAYSRVQKTAYIFNNVCYARETILYTSMQNWSRGSKYSGHTFMVKDNWYPYMNGILKDYLPINLPVGQNMQYFFYNTIPTLNYWMFSIIWGSISVGLFAAGIVVYNKYDVK